VHARVDFPLRDRPAALRAFVEDAADLAAAHGGSVSGEHGDGRTRGELLPRMYSAAAIELFGAVKHAFDPDGLLNPGVIVRPAPLDADLRLPSVRPVARGLGYAYPHDDGDFATAVHRCVGVGKCRADTTASGGVMCPSYLATRDEKDSTRGRARVLQELVNGGLLTGGWSSPAVSESLDLCLACKGCSTDCPAGVDMALVNGCLRVRPVSRVAKQIAGIDARRPLPSFAPSAFRRWFAGHPSASGAPVLLWVDTFTNHFAPDVGRAAVRVLEAAGYSVRVTDRPVCCGLTWISTGQLDAARRRLRRALDALDPALRDGTPIVGLEPSCTAVLRDDAAKLLPDDPRPTRVAAATHTLAEILRATPGWVPPDLSGVRGVAQPHCHHRAVLGWEPDMALLRNAGARIDAIGGCCGLAGNFGFESGHYDVSHAIAETALLPAVRAAPAGAVILADGYSCRTQLEQLSSRRGQHLAQLLADHIATPTPDADSVPGG
jgi:Fe-S oxidoreductase